jgi:hypothetical protein
MPPFQLPDIKVWNVANDYQISASLLNEKSLEKGSAPGYGWVAGINAAIALEIYLKSFLSQEKLTPVGVGGIYQQNSDVTFGHSLPKLYQKIDPSFKSELKSSFAKLYPKRDLEISLDRYKEDFVDGRYRFEVGSRARYDNDIVYFAEQMRWVVWDVVEKLHK